MMLKFPVYVKVTVVALALTGLVGPGQVSAKPKASDLTTSSDAPVQAKDAQWTIFCLSLAGPLHVEQSKNMKQWLLANTRQRDWYIIHGDRESTLYHGFYRSINDLKDKDTTRARSDRASIDAIEDAQGVRPFAQCVFVETSSPDPAAPVEWNLTSARGAYTLEIAVYKDSPLRKEAAVEAVREARKQGVEAYFYHGPTASSVCVGTWPEEAVQGTRQEAGAVQTRRGDETLMVLPFSMQGAIPKNIEDDRGIPVRVIAPKFNPIDPTIVETMKKYPEFSINGENVARRIKRPDGTEAIEFQRSQLMEIPRVQESMLTGIRVQETADQNVGQRVVGAPGAGTEAAGPAQPKPRQPTTPGAGRLRSISDK